MGTVTTSGEWLEKALLDLKNRSSNSDSGVDLDADLISGLVSFCELAPPPDAADYLKNIIGPEAGQQIISEYLQRRGYVFESSTNSVQKAQTSSNFQPYKKPLQANQLTTSTTTKKPSTGKSQTDHAESSNNNAGGVKISRKSNKNRKAISLAEAVKGSVVFRKGEPCSCQARRHKLVSNCLSCGKIVCEQEGEGPCNFCGALVLREGSTYAGLDDEQIVRPLSDAEAKAEAYAKRLVDYDRNSAARTMVIDDQSDYYEFETNNWLSEKEKALLRKKQKEIEEAEKERKGKVVVTFDLVGRKVIMNNESSDWESAGNRILGGQEETEKTRIKPNPTINIQPVFTKSESSRGQNENRHKRISNGLCLEISGRVQHDNLRIGTSSADATVSYVEDDGPECSFVRR